MINSTNILYSASAAKRIMGTEARVRVQVWAKVILVAVEGFRPRFVSKQVFKQHFVNRRKQEARALEAHQINHYTFTVINEAKGSRYDVSAVAGRVFCSCEDYKNQLDFFGKAACKHSYAVLNYLGYDSLADYIKATAA